MPLTSGAGGSWNEGNSPASAGFFGPGSSRLVGFLPLIRPSGGESGFPNEPAVAELTTPRAAAEAAAPTRIFRRDMTVMVHLSIDFADGKFQSRGYPRDFTRAPRD